MFKCDYHTHTNFSFDGAKNSTPETLCEAAIANGVTDLAITDHFECNWKTEAAYPEFDADGHYAAIMAAKEKYGISDEILDESYDLNQIGIIIVGLVLLTVVKKVMKSIQNF